LKTAAEFLEFKQFKHPLPVHLEKPFRRFGITSDTMVKYGLGKQLFSSIIKTVLFLLYEEVAQLEKRVSETDANMESIKESKPLSDGAYLSFLEKLVNELDRKKIHLPVFSSLSRDLLDFQAIQTLQSLVKFRNDEAHGRIKAKVFLAELAEKLPPLLQRLRSSLKDVLFLEVKSISILSESQTKVNYRKAMGWEPELESGSFTTKLDPRRFIENEFVAYNEQSGDVVRLNRFFDIKVENVETLSIGVLENFDNGEPSYNYNE